MMVKKEKIAAIHPAFRYSPRLLALMECADRVLSKAAHFMCTAGVRLPRSRSDLSCHHVMTTWAIGGLTSSSG